MDAPSVVDFFVIGCFTASVGIAIEYRQYGIAASIALWTLFAIFHMV